MAKLIITQLVIDERGIPIRSMVVGSKIFLMECWMRFYR